MQHYTTSTPQSSIVLSSARADVTGDKIADTIYLVGQKTFASPFIQNITIIVYDGKTGNQITAPLKNNVGYNPTLFLGDFTGDGVSDVFVHIDSGGSGAFTYDYLYSFLGGVPKMMFSSDDYNLEYTYDVEYKDYYKVEVTSQKNNANYIIDISYKGPDYLNEIYESNGKLKAPLTGFVNPVSAVYPVDINSDGIYELLAFQKIAGKYNADTLGYIENFLKWNGNELALFNQYLGVLGDT